MQLKTIITSAMTALSLGSSVVTVAGSQGVNNYYPPERIHCSVQNNKLLCGGFNHRYLIEDIYTANIRQDEKSFSFASGAAYYDGARSEATVFFTYHDARSKTVKLRSATTAIRPDFNGGKWTKVQGDLYVCDAGYMHCPVTSLPVKR
tara:strand:- start:328 stop:771 length:444 start_codon:yes stop_codon:yes gene_type:complete